MNSYTTVQGDMWDSIAFRVYGDERYINVLLNANPEYAHMIVLTGGIVIRCPEISVEATQILPPWRR
ncbi:tail protein X [Veillonella caviae]|uniref:tail protein X n=1 Tax=Veillonella caviae TaxID=248316 RepID=UPI0023A8635D|nr:tail protein X [Veillonella caviae]MCI5708582.1 tail protein X [Veillonella caviae]MDY5716122.1 tail protein X [Veillonella caviae]